MKSCHQSMFVCFVIASVASLTSVSSTLAITINPSGSGTLGTVNFLSGNLARGTHAAGGNLVGLSPVETTDDPTLTTGRPGSATIDGANDGVGTVSPAPIGPNGFHASSTGFWRVNLGDLSGQPNAGNHTYAFDSLSIYSRTDCCAGQSNGTVDVFNETDTATLFAPANLGTISTSLAVTPVISQSISGFDPTTSITFPFSFPAIGKSLEYRTGSFMEFEANGLANLILGSGDVLQLDVTSLGSDFLNVEGTANLSNATIQLAMDPGFTGSANLLTASSIDLTGTQFLGVLPGYLLQVADIPGGQTLQLVAEIPEPSSLLLCALGLIGLLRRRKQKN